MRYNIYTYVLLDVLYRSHKDKSGGELCYEILRRIRSIAEFYLQRDLVFSVAAREQEDSFGKQPPH